MADPVRERIAQNLEATLKLIKKTSGYHFDVRPENVKRVVGGGGIPTEFPTIYLMSGSDTPFEYPLERITFNWQVSIGAWVRATTQADVAKYAEYMLADIRQILQQDYARNNDAINTVPGAAKAPIVVDADTEFRAYVECLHLISYQTERTNLSLP